MQHEQIQKILEQLNNHDARLRQLETHIIPATTPKVVGAKSDKQRTLREIVKGKKFNNGQEQVAAVVWYHEKILGKKISKDKIKDEWTNAKMNGDFASVYLSRAKGDLIRVDDGGTCDLTQSGETLLDNLLNNESAGATFK